MDIFLNNEQELIKSMNVSKSNESEKISENIFNSTSIQTIQSEKTYVIDRFEENYAVCENRDSKEMINIEISKLPSNIQEGDVLTFKDNVYTIDENKKKEIEERINEKVRNIFED